MRILSMMLTLLVLAGCSGYKPLYGTSENGQNVTDVLSQVNVAEQRTRTGQLIRNELLSGLDATGTSRFQLNLSVNEYAGAISTTPGTVVLRKRYYLSTHYELVETGKTNVINAGTSFANVSYDTVREPVADLQAAENARVRAATQVGQDIRQRLAAFLATHKI
jgi:LPS-assembly lipoprotein